jgi:6-phosphogluconolactonase
MFSEFGFISNRTRRRSFLRNLSLVTGTASLAPLASAMVATQDGPLLAYVGTFSSPLQDVLPTQVDLPPGNGRGIHVFEVDRADGSLKFRDEVRMGSSPSSLVINAQGTRLYSANETDQVGSRKEGSVSAFEVDPQTGSLSLLNTVPSGGAGPTYVSLTPSGEHLLVANYFGGTVAVLPVLANGRLGPATDVKIDEGPIGPTRATNSPPGSFAISGHDRTHAHMIAADDRGRYVLHADLGLDRIYVWRFDPSSGKLLPNDPPFVSFPPGDGPRHFHFHPNGRWLYSVQEEGSNVVGFRFDQETGRLEAFQTISTLPQGYTGSNFCSEILVSPDGHYLYAGNRLHDSIAIFKILEDGKLEYVREVWTQGNYPRSFNFDPSGQFLYVCNQRSDNVAVFRVDSKNGSLQFTGHYAPVGNPSCVVFRDFADR